MTSARVCVPVINFPPSFPVPGRFQACISPSKLASGLALVGVKGMLSNDYSALSLT